MLHRTEYAVFRYIEKWAVTKWECVIHFVTAHLRIKQTDITMPTCFSVECTNGIRQAKVHKKAFAVRCNAWRLVFADVFWENSNGFCRHCKMSFLPYVDSVWCAGLHSRPIPDRKGKVLLLYDVCCGSICLSWEIPCLTHAAAFFLLIYWASNNLLIGILLKILFI